MCPAREHLIFLTLLIISRNVDCSCPLTDPDVSLSILICVLEHTSSIYVEHTSFHVWKVHPPLVLCLFVPCPGIMLYIFVY